MRLTAFTDYSLRVLMFLAAEPDRRATVGEICAAFDIKANHLTKVVHHLARRGWVSTVRGKGGGLTLARPAAQIRVGDVVRDTEGQALPAECFSAEASHCAIVSHCRLRGVLGEAVQAFHAVLDRYTLADITANRQQLVELLRFMAPAGAAA
ncbi:MAG: Rrf2 family transcriptional regulator [Burkholderiales bacterium]|jgi:Rrf2 family nitric oxide-sensitive transcriptional repressor|nr:Rrf2 family transcriptional regulator [Burkholderiales bacterium]